MDVTPRTQVRRAPKRASYDRATVEAILDEALVCHLAIIHDGHPFCIPTLHARVGDMIYVHGSAASRLIRTCQSGAPACLTVTIIDGVVLARSAFHHSMNYRSAMVLGAMHAIDDPAERSQALQALTERLLPGRWDVVRPPNLKELKATNVLAMPLAEASAKARTGPPVDDEDDYALAVWAGVVPVGLTTSEPQPDARLEPGVALPTHVRALRDRLSRAMR